MTARGALLGRQFGITEAEYERILEAQGGVCAVCGRPPGTVRLAVDHDHRTGLIRGLLDWHCNHALGVFRDSTHLLRVAASYLEHPPAIDSLGRRVYGLKGKVGNKRATVKRLNGGVTDARKLPQNQRKP